MDDRPPGVALAAGRAGNDARQLWCAGRPTQPAISVCTVPSPGDVASSPPFWDSVRRDRACNYPLA